MKRNIILFAGLLAGFTLSAQKVQNAASANEAVAKRTVGDGIIPSSNYVNKGKSGEAVIYSEDFSTGLPAGWTNIGSSPNALWEYRGPSTTPDVTTGSRGAWRSGTTVIASPTASNGFFIFDSDYLDNGGDQNGAGTGVAPTPHVGSLTTGTIDLSGYPAVQLSVHSYYRYFAGRALVALSSDDGLTFPDTVRLYGDVAVNASTSTDEVANVNISPYVGNSATVKLAFIFDGNFDEPAANDIGYYFWMLDDIAIEELPDHELQFTTFKALDANNNEITVPAQDMIFDSVSPGSSKMGVMHAEHIVPIHFDGNILNYGGSAQTGVALKVDIYDASNSSLIQSLTTPTTNLASGQYETYEVFTTQQWTAPGAGTYDILYTAISDSVPAAAGSVQPVDSFRLVVSNEFSSLDFGNIDNTIGNNQLGTDGAAVASRFHFDNTTTVVPNANWVDANAIDIYISTSTVTGGEIVFKAYDTTGFDYVNGFGSAALFSKSFTIDASMVGTVATFDLTDATSGVAPQLPIPATYFIVAELNSFGGTSIIQVGNDQTFDQPGASSIMYNADDGRWYSGYAGDSRSFESPILRLSSNSAKGIGLSETEKIKFAAYPNPSNGNFTVDIEKGGDYTISVINTAGQQVFADKVEATDNYKYNVELNDAPKGVYFLTVANGVRSSVISIAIK